MTFFQFSSTYRLTIYNILRNNLKYHFCAEDIHLSLHILYMYETPPVLCHYGCSKKTEEVEFDSVLHLRKVKPHTIHIDDCLDVKKNVISVFDLMPKCHFCDESGAI